MDVTTGAIVLIFIISIFGGFGGNKSYTPPPSGIPTSSPTAPVFPTENTYREATGIEPPTSFASVNGLETQLAIQKYITRYRSNDEAVSIAASIVRHCQTYDLNPKLAAAVIARESKFNPRALSSSGAVGLGQLLPSTARGLGVTEPYDIDQNAKGTVRYIKSMVDRFPGKVSFALGSYLEGPNAVARNNGYTTHTKSYVEDILAIYQKI